MNKTEKRDQILEPIDVWIVEDAQEYRLELVRLLNATPGIRCARSFGSAEEALPIFHEGLFPHVVLVDIQLPGASGIDLIKELQVLRPTVHPVVLTISENRTVVFDAICAGASGYLLKNDPFDEIVRGIRLVFDGGSPLSGPVASMVLAAFKRKSSLQNTGQLSERETDILRLLADGFINKEIADQQHIAPSTVDYHLRSIYKKLQVNSQAGAVGTAMRKGLI